MMKSPEIRRQQLEALLARVPAKWATDSSKTHMRNAGLLALGTVRKFINEDDRLRADRNLSDEGRRVGQQVFASNVHGDVKAVFFHLSNARQALANHQRNLFPIDPNNLAEAMRRAEMREFLRGKNFPEIVAIADEVGDRIFYQSLMEVPAALTGLNAEQREIVVRQYLAVHAPTVLEDYRENQEALELAETAVAILTEEVTAAAGFATEHEFLQWADAA